VELFLENNVFFRTFYQRQDFDQIIDMIFYVRVNKGSEQKETHEISHKTTEEELCQQNVEKSKQVQVKDIPRNRRG
jgi:hypothetical protein